MEKQYEIKDINFSFENNPIFVNSNLKLFNNTITSVIGENGAGKTTLLKILSGLINTDLTVSDNDSSLEKIDFYKKLIFIPNQNILYENLSYQKNAEIVKYLWKKDTSYLENVEKVLEMLNFDTTNLSPISTYSDGMKQKINVAIFLSLDKEIVILDEPFNQMDTNSFEKAVLLLKQYVQRNKIVIYSAHNKELIDCSNFAYIIENQKIKKAVFN